MRRKIVGIGAVFIMASLLLAGVAQATLVTTFTTSKERYDVGELVDITLTNTEESDEDTSFVYHAVIITHIDTGKIVYREHRRLGMYRPISPGDSETRNWGQCYHDSLLVPINPIPPGDPIPFPGEVEANERGASPYQEGEQVPSGNYKAEYEGQVTYFRIGIVTVEDANDYVQELPDDAFGARPDQTRMFYNRMFELADRLVDSGEERAADAILEHVILSTMDGSLTPDDPRDDRNDRITDPTAQAVLTGCISNLIGR